MPSVADRRVDTFRDWKWDKGRDCVLLFKKHRPVTRYNKSELVSAIEGVKSQRNTYTTHEAYSRRLTMFEEGLAMICETEGDEA